MEAPPPGQLVGRGDPEAGAAVDDRAVGRMRQLAALGGPGRAAEGGGEQAEGPGWELAVVDAGVAAVLGEIGFSVVAGLLVIGGRIVAGVVVTAVGRAMLRATGKQPKAVLRTLEVTIIALVSLVAAGQLGIDTTILNILVSAIAFGAALAMALLIGIGGRETSREIAAGRAMGRVLAMPSCNCSRRSGEELSSAKSPNCASAAKGAGFARRSAR